MGNETKSIIEAWMMSWGLQVGKSSYDDALADLTERLTASPASSVEDAARRAVNRLLGEFASCLLVPDGYTHLMFYGERWTDIIATEFASQAEDVPLCPVHEHLDKKGKLEMTIGGLNCVACSLAEREQLLELLAPLAPKDDSEDSLTVLHKLVDFYDEHYGEGRVVVSYPAPRSPHTECLMCYHKGPTACFCLCHRSQAEVPQGSCNNFEHLVAVEKLTQWTDPDVLFSPFVGTCIKCGTTESYVYHVPEAQWRRIVPETWWNEIVCAGCFHQLASTSPQSAVHNHQAELVQRDGFMCEQHPGKDFPHDDCAGPGMPWIVEGKMNIAAIAVRASSLTEAQAKERARALVASWVKFEKTNVALTVDGRDGLIDRISTELMSVATSEAGWRDISEAPKDSSWILGLTLASE